MYRCRFPSDRWGIVRKGGLNSKSLSRLFSQKVCYREVYLITGESFCPAGGTKLSEGYGELPARIHTGKWYVGVYQNTCGGALDPLELKLLENITVWGIKKRHFCRFLTILVYQIYLAHAVIPSKVQSGESDLCPIF